MRLIITAAAGLAALSLAACESKADKAAEKQADAVEAATETHADAIEKQAGKKD